MNAQPKKLPEWKAYIETLDADALFEQAAQANSITFVQQLKGDGLSGPEIKEIFEHFVARLTAKDELPPGGGYFDLRKMVP